jgi:16S rRNA processing protein RimM
LSEARELIAGRVGRPHGLDGSFYATGPLTRLLTLGASVTIGGRELEIVRRAGTAARPILRLEGVDDRAGAEALRGEQLTIASQDAPQLGEGEWWAHELEGCEVLDETGRSLGTVAGLLGLPSCEVLEVRRPSSVEPLLVPLVKDAIRAVDIGTRRVEIDAEFLGLGAPERGD